MDLSEVKRIIAEQGEVFEEFKRSLAALESGKAEAKAIGDVTAKIETLSAALDKLADGKAQLEAQLLKMQRPGGASEGDVKQAELEVKQFNTALRADFAVKGRAYPGDITREHYAEYKSGFFKMIAGVSFDSLEPTERKAMQTGSDPDGGYMLPASTQGAIVTRTFEQSIMRQICDVQTITTEKIEGLVDNDEADAGWVSELGTRNDTDTPQVQKYEIVAHEMYAQPKASQKVLDDAATDIEGWLAAKVADKFGRVEGLAFWQGSGVGQARGLASYTTAATPDSTRAWGQFEHVVSGANGAFHTTQFDPVLDLQGALKEVYQPNAQFLMRRNVRTAARKLKESTTNRYLWEPGMQVGEPERLMGYPARVDEYMPTLTTGSLSFAFGDFRRAYKIVDRMGIRVLRDPYTAKPYVKFYSTRRVGGGALDFEAVKFLKFST